MNKRISLKIKQSKLGFTLIEIMLIVIIMASLSAMVVPRLVGRSEKTKRSVAQTDINSYLATALKLYELDNGFFPTTSQGLSALLKKPSTSPVPRKWNGPYIEKAPIDPWGNEYEYASPGRKRSDYDLYSKGKDPQTDSDDISNWQ